MLSVEEGATLRAWSHVRGVSVDGRPTELAARVAREALMVAGVAPPSLGLVVFTGDDVKEHPSWTAALHLQNRLGAVRALAFDVGFAECGLHAAWKIAGELLLALPPGASALVAGASTSEGSGMSAGAVVMTRGGGGPKLRAVRLSSSGALDELAPWSPRSPSSASALGRGLAGCLRLALMEISIPAEALLSVALPDPRRETAEALLEGLGSAHLRPAWGSLVAVDTFAALGALDAWKRDPPEGDVALLGVGAGVAFAATVLSWRDVGVRR